jgi:auxin responsive GH3 family protein/jasmonic acid-amino synthetase
MLLQVVYVVVLFRCGYLQTFLFSTAQAGDKVLNLQVPMTICSSEEIIDEFELLTRDARRVQQDTLRKILELNGHAEYLNRFNLGTRTDSKSFKSCIPLCVHSDIESYIQRIADGDDSLVLTGKPITSLSVRY